MNDKFTRRKFIKSSTIAGGALLVSGVPFGEEGQAAPAEPAVAPDVLLKGVSDLHIHAMPDTGQRSVNELELARVAQQAGYRSVMFKANYFSCHDRAYLIREALPGFECFGSLCMNRDHGDKVNVFAVEQALKTTGNYCRCIWMPTLDASYQLATDKRPGKGIPVLGDTGEVLPEVVRVMELCAEANIIFATGHAGPEESIILAKKAKDVGVGKFVVTHANSRIWKMTHEQINRCLEQHAFIEYSYLPVLWGPGSGMPSFPRLSKDEFIGYARIMPERCFITTDMGQATMPNPLEGMRLCITDLLNAGVPQKDVNLMVRSNPAMLMGLGAN